MGAWSHRRPRSACGSSVRFSVGEAPPWQRLVLTGFMGSGKTTIGRLLAERLAWHFADLDGAVEARADQTVPQIFATAGETTFRALEVEALTVLLKETNIVIALGGGAPGSAGVRALLRNTAQTLVVHLHAPFEELYRRCTLQASDPAATSRPLLGARHEAEQRWRDRQSFYDGVAHHRVEVGEGSPNAITMEILSCIGMHM